MRDRIKRASIFLKAYGIHSQVALAQFVKWIGEHCDGDLHHAFNQARVELKHFFGEPDPIAMVILAETFMPQPVAKEDPVTVAVEPSAPLEPKQEDESERRQRRRRGQESEA